MDQRDQRQRRRGAVDRINTGIDAIRKTQTAIKMARTAGTAAEVISTSEIWIPIVIVVAVILIIVAIILGTTSGGAIDLGSANPAPGGGSPGSGNISSCQFTRAGQGYSIKSSILAGWITDAANRASIPPSVLASVAMHENQNFLTTYDNNSPEIINNNFCGSEGVSCTNTTTNTNIHVGACTLEEIQRGGVATDRHRGLLQISNYFYPTVNACNITESLTWATNKLKDYILNSTPTEAQVKAAITAYGGFTPGQPCTSHAGYPYDYCDEVWQDYQNCQTTNIIAPPISGDKRQAIIDEFNVTMNEFDDQHLGWAWEKLWEVSNTRFTSLIAGSTIQSQTGNISSQVGCFGGQTSVKIFQFATREFFQYLLTHELGHVIASCRPSEARVYDARNAFDREGAVSYYAANALHCAGSENYSEDYADMITYYLNPSAGLSTKICDDSPRNPPNPLHGNPILKPIHKNVAEEVLGNFP